VSEAATTTTLQTELPPELMRLPAMIGFQNSLAVRPQADRARDSERRCKGGRLDALRNRQWPARRRIGGLELGSSAVLSRVSELSKDGDASRQATGMSCQR
jgi:hypothetical protein